MLLAGRQRALRQGLHRLVHRLTWRIQARHAGSSGCRPQAPLEPESDAGTCPEMTSSRRARAPRRCCATAMWDSTEQERAQLAVLFDSLEVVAPLRRALSTAASSSRLGRFRHTRRAQLRSGGELARLRRRRSGLRRRRRMFIDVSGSINRTQTLCCVWRIASSRRCPTRPRSSRLAPGSPGSAQPCEYGRPRRRWLRWGGWYLTGPAAPAGRGARGIFSRWAAAGWRAVHWW